MVKGHLPSCSDKTPGQIGKFVEFQLIRRLHYGRSMSEMMGTPELKSDGWYRSQWKAFNEELPIASLGEWASQKEGKAEWARAWYEEVVCNIMVEGELRPPCSVEMGVRFFGQATVFMATQRYVVCRYRRRRRVLGHEVGSLG